MSTAAEKLAALQARRGITAPPERPEFDPDLVPEVEESTYQRTEDDEAVDAVLDRLDIVDAYNRWCGKMVPNVGSKRESIHISCPDPAHKDDHTSAWINLDKQVYYCEPCQHGGDKFDIAAFKFGFPVPGYKEGKNFPELRRAMAEDLGVVFAKGISGEYVAELPPDTGREENSASATGPAESGGVTTESSQIQPEYKPDTPDIEPEKSAEIVQFPQAGDFDDAFIEYPRIDWPAVCNTDGFLAQWMDVTKEDDLPEEFYFWLGMVALGFAIGRDASLEDNPLVHGNLYVCLYGPTGQGKSRSIGNLNRLLNLALPYDHSDPNSTGAYMVPSPGSAEALVDAFSRPIEDPNDPKQTIGYGHVRGLVRFDELSTLIGRASRMGNPMKPMLMEFYDGYAAVEHKTRGMGHVRAEGHFCSTLTTTQPRAIRDLLVQTDVDSGFVNRWIFASGPEKTRVAIGRKQLDIDSCVDPLRDVRGWSANSASTRLKMTTGADQRWAEFFHDELTPVQKQDQSGLFARCDLMLKKVMLLLCADRRRNQIDTELVEDAINVWTYLQRSYKLLSGEIGMGPFEDIRCALRNAIAGHEARHKKPPTMRDILRLVAHRSFQLDLVVRVLEAMVKVEEVQEIKPNANTPGRKTMSYHYVD